MNSQYLSAIAIVVTLIFNVGLATAGITGEITCTVAQAGSQAASAAAALW